MVQHLKEKWWIEKNYQTINGEIVNCTNENTSTSSDTPDLDIEHIIGAFLVLMCGFGLAILIGILEFLWNVRKVSISLKVIRLLFVQHAAIGLISQKSTNAN